MLQNLHNSQQMSACDSSDTIHLHKTTLQNASHSRYIARMSRKYKINDQDKLHFLSFATIKWIDLFVREEYCYLFTDSLKYCQEHKRLEVYGWCIMPSHVHLIIGTVDQPMENIVRDLKSYTSRALKEEIKNHPGESRREWIVQMMELAGRMNNNNSNWQLWQQHNQPIELSTNNMIDQRLDYLHMNPVESGFVSEPEHWKFSSAIDYSGGKGIVDVCFV